ncbi:iron-regulated ABC transporter permease protein SufD [Antricoccus suffuscus]|uniref:Iron-regulated ABC transporter permease protein SufD n=1 Tax=Antricoccus suffuscus TaxID=1629062 RepID=A0A2T1A5X6_9ACTN|nr:Fe-S cluster assembly protein SufD [Antricoccus suffuscus]PRZ43738.1 iron-regulated ABC transporter permease protein SufD [Antricoccus suffuscus]
MATDLSENNVATALAENERIESHLHPQGSTDLDAHLVPTGHEEVWRFTPMRRLAGLHKDTPIGDASALTIGVDAPDGVLVTQEGNDTKGASGYLPADRIAARAWHAADGALTITVPTEAVIDAPTIVTISGESIESASAQHLVIKAEAFSKATIVLRYTGSAMLTENVEIIASDSAKLTVVSLQDWADDAIHLTHHHALVSRDAMLRHVAVTFGGDVVRFTGSVEYDGPGGEVELLGIYFADAGQHLEHRLFVDHNAPKTISNVDYKGALQGKDAHGVWIGDVLIRKIAQGINTYESNRNLVLTDGCRADSVPNLEIETGDIEGAGHASTTGRFDDEQLFYLQSRGISAEEARRLVVRGFFADIIRKIGIPDIEAQLVQAVEDELRLSNA